MFTTIFQRQSPKPNHRVTCNFTSRTPVVLWTSAGSKAISVSVWQAQRTIHCNTSSTWRTPKQIERQRRSSTPQTTSGWCSNGQTSQSLVDHTSLALYPMSQMQTRLIYASWHRHPLRSTHRRPVQSVTVGSLRSALAFWWSPPRAWLSGGASLTEAAMDQSMHRSSTPMMLRYTLAVCCCMIAN